MHAYTYELKKYVDVDENSHLDSKHTLLSRYRVDAALQNVAVTPQVIIHLCV